MNLPTAIIGALGMILASAFTSWASSNNATAEVRTQVVQITEREQNHYAEIQKQLVSIDAKLDKILGNKTSIK
ncbi:MAG: hypothetical protein AAB922_07720 [Patescibacteria group bacterium]